MIADLLAEQRLEQALEWPLQRLEFLGETEDGRAQRLGNAAIEQGLPEEVQTLVNDVEPAL